MRTTRISRWLPDLAYLGIGALLFVEIFLQDARFIDRDLLHVWYPVGQSIADAFQGTGSFLWDGGIGHGVPFLARWAHGVLYPSHWLVALLPVDTAITVGIFLHLVLAACAMRRLALRYTSNTSAAWLAGLCFAFGGYFLSMIGLGTYLFSSALLPLSLLALHRLAERPDLSRALQLSLVMMLQVLVPDPQTLYFEVLVLAPVVLLLHTSRAVRGRAVLAFALAGALALAGGTAQLWPTWEMYSHSVRAGGLPAETAVWAFHPLRVLELAAPGVFGNPTTGTTFWAPFLVNSHIDRSWTSSIHLGLVPLVGLLFLPWRGRRRVIIAWGCVTLLFLVLALGNRTPLFALLQQLPVLGSFRFPEKYMLFVVLGISLLGCVGLGRLLDDLARGKGSNVNRALIALGSLAGVLAVARLCTTLFSEWARGVVVSLGAPVSAQEAVAAANHALERSAAVAVVLLVLLLFRDRVRPALLLASLLVVAVIDLATAGLPLRMLGGAEWLDQRPRLCSAIPPADRGLKPTVWHDMRMSYRGDPPGTRGPESTSERFRRWQMNTLKRNIGTAHCVRYAVGMEEWLLQHKRLTLALLKHSDHMVDLYGVRFIVEQIGALPAAYPARALFPELGVGVYENDGLPFAYGLSAVVSAPDNEAAIARVAKPTFPLRRTAVFESEAPLPAFPPAKRRVELGSYRPGRIELDVSYSAPGYLVVLESSYPGWSASVGGRETRTWRANGAFMGLKVPAGEHRVTLVFAPRSHRLAIWVSAGSLVLTLLALAGLLVWKSRRTRPR